MSLIVVRVGVVLSGYGRVIDYNGGLLHRRGGDRDGDGGVSSDGNGAQFTLYIWPDGVRGVRTIPLARGDRDQGEFRG